jgi:hypothetical protein
MGGGRGEQVWVEGIDAQQPEMAGAAVAVAALLELCSNPRKEKRRGKSRTTLRG